MGRVGAMVLGVVTAIGGFLDIGELVAMPQAGAEYRFGLLWALLLGTIGAMAYAEITGRVELASQRAVFDVIRERLGVRGGMVPLTAALALNTLTLVAEIGGMAYFLELATSIGFLWFVVPCGVGLFLFALKGTFSRLENVPSALGVAMLVFPAALIWGTMDVNWGLTARHVLVPEMLKDDWAVYAITAIAIIGAALTPYEWYFYSSGGREEAWTPRDLVVNRVTAIGGFGFGSLLAFSLMVGAATLLYPISLTPAHLGQTGLLAASAFGRVGLVLFIIGGFGCVLGASIEVSLSTAQAMSQFFGYSWGSSRRPRDVPGFTLLYAVPIVLSVALLLLGIPPIKVTIIALVLATIALPFTFWPLMVVANDPLYMGKLKNGLLSNTLGAVYLVLLTLAALAAIPLMIITGGAA